MDKPNAYRPPILWVPSSFFAMGTVYTVVTTAANIMFANLGLTVAQATFYSSMTAFVYTFNPFWAPILELYRTKKFFVIAAQVVLAVILCGIGGALSLRAFVVPVVALLMVGALAGATQDIVANGVYVTTLDARRQAAFTGIQSMSWSIGPILASSFLVMLVGRLAGETGSTSKPSAQAYGGAWCSVFVGLGILMAVLAAWHVAVLPSGSKADDAPKSFGDVVATFGQVFVTFFQKRDIFKLMGFAFFYRFGLGLLDKVAPLFVLDSRVHGGLGLDNGKLGLLNGIATASLHRRIRARRMVRLEAWPSTVAAHSVPVPECAQHHIPLSRLGASRVDGGYRPHFSGREAGLGVRGGRTHGVHDAADRPRAVQDSALRIRHGARSESLHGADRTGQRLDSKATLATQRSSCWPCSPRRRRSCSPGSHHFTARTDRTRRRSSFPSLEARRAFDRPPRGHSRSG